MKKINIWFWYFFDRKRYNLFQYIQSLGFDSDSSYKDTKNSKGEAVDFLLKK